SGPEATLPEINIDTELTETPGRVVRAEAGAQPAHPLHDRREIHADSLRYADAEFPRVPHLGHYSSRPDNRLARHATDVETVAAHQLALDERDFGAEPGRAGRRHQAGRPGADHHQVVTLGGRRVHPIGRMNIGLEALIVAVPWS